ncbi:flagellar export chaperone FliS [Planosporangium sp. 12N6]|uniref:flagellar export chaperone FliS n=1 Tax=Planosporangium spinosum TaxID=3402278 RepID=UPI003CF2BE78
MTSPALRDRYLADAINTASPARLLVMLYDRLLLDLIRGEQALREGNRDEGSAQLLHAQEIVLELTTTLDTGAWSGAAALAQVYVFLLNELMAANVRADAERVAECRKLVEPLSDAWRQAALAAATESAPNPSASRVA